MNGTAEQPTKRVKLSDQAGGPMPKMQELTEEIERLATFLSDALH
jgi:hypothetical protein